MKQMESTIKVVTDGPVNPEALLGAFAGKPGIVSAIVTNYRMLPVKKAGAK